MRIELMTELSETDMSSVVRTVSVDPWIHFHFFQLAIHFAVA